ncbi:BrnT family toxin [Sorangium sp. So ce118]
MAGLRFEWDARESAANKRKHGVSFDEARTVFADDRALLLDDPDHSEGEDRFILLGLSATARTLVVCHCYRQDGDVIRIISARRAAPSERATYTTRWKP